MSDQMEFPETFEKFSKEYGFKDDKEVYTNGSDLIQIFRVKQWLEHDNKLRKIETDTAYECGRHANKWIPVSERLPETAFGCLVTVEEDDRNGEPQSVLYPDFVGYDGETWNDADGVPIPFEVIAWMSLPEPYKAESEG